MAEADGRDLLCSTSMLRLAIETERRRWFCSGSDCEAYDDGRDEGFDLALRAFDKERERQISARLSICVTEPPEDNSNHE